MKKPSQLRFLTTTLIATVLTALFVFLGSPFLRVLRSVFGAAKYWVAMVVLGVGFWLSGAQPVALLLVSVWATIGLYSEAEERGFAGFWVAAGAVIAGSATLILGMISWARVSGFDVVELLSQGIDSLAQQMATTSGSSAIKLDSHAIISQTPSAVVLLMMVSLGLALMLDRRASLMLDLRLERVATHMRLLEFKNPDALIWLTMISFLGSFIKIQPPLVGLVASNVFNVTMGLYFFQGLAVLEVSFLAFRVGSFTKFLVYFFIVGQLFFLLSLVGVIDYWVDFRARMKRFRTREDNQKMGNI